MPDDQKTTAELELGISEGRLLLLVSAVQFVNILDFMIVMPLGPDFAKALAIPVSRLGLVGGSYTAAAAIAGLISAQFLDRFDRRSALGVTMFGLIVGTACGGLATGLPTLMLARVLAGTFGGPATSLSLSILADVIPPLRRGRALGLVMAAFSVASVFGVPAGLELARWGGWRLPFFGVAALGVVVATGAIFVMPPLRLHLSAGREQAHRRLGSFLREPAVLLSLVATFTVMMASFSVIPNLSAYIQHNLGYPRSRLGLLYLVGGSFSFVAMQVVGRFVDRLGASFMGSLGTALFIALLGVVFVIRAPWFPVMGFFVVFMTSMAFRNVALNALTSRVPASHERARFMSLQSAVQHIASAAGAISSALCLRELPDHRLEGMPTVASISMTLALALPVLLGIVQKRVHASEHARAQMQNPAQP